VHLITIIGAEICGNSNLKQALNKYNIDEILLCGMMTQNCVTHTAISRKAEKYKVLIIEDCCKGNA